MIPAPRQDKLNIHTLFGQRFAGFYNLNTMSPFSRDPVISNIQKMFPHKMWLQDVEDRAKESRHDSL
jgi:hypothetical protein